MNHAGLHVGITQHVIGDLLKQLPRPGLEVSVSARVSFEDDNSEHRGLLSDELIVCFDGLDVASIAHRQGSRSEQKSTSYIKVVCSDATKKWVNPHSAITVKVRHRKTKRKRTFNVGLRVSLEEACLHYHITASNKTGIKQYGYGESPEEITDHLVDPKSLPRIAKKVREMLDAELSEIALPSDEYAARIAEERERARAAVAAYAARHEQEQQEFERKLQELIASRK